MRSTGWASLSEPSRRPTPTKVRAAFLDNSTDQQTIAGFHGFPEGILKRGLNMSVGCKVLGPLSAISDSHSCRSQSGAALISTHTNQCIARTDNQQYKTCWPSSLMAGTAASTMWQNKVQRTNRTSARKHTRTTEESRRWLCQASSKHVGEYRTT